ncbi:MAG TPA: type II secretion system protein [Candidatus Paceibacterota bacterium]|nr:type II secretion system protein [Candidatus Paceibacterota bacterium]
MELRRTCTTRGDASRAYTRGFTLIEVLIVIGLVTLVGGMTIIFSTDSFRGHNFRAERNTLVAVVAKARSQSINNMCFGESCTGGKPHGVRFDKDRVTIFQGPSWEGRDASVDEAFPIHSRAVVLSGLPQIVFEALSGNALFPGGPGSVQIRDTSGVGSSTISFNAIGRICVDENVC